MILIELLESLVVMYGLRLVAVVVTVGACLPWRMMLNGIGRAVMHLLYV